MAHPIRVSAKQLGSIALGEFCPRCFWLRMRVKDKLPFQIFPGIFNTIDSYGKRLVQGWFDRHGGPPPWLSDLGSIRSSLDPPHFSKFNILDQDTSIALSGSPDAIFLMSDGSHSIIDYKTAKITETQDELFPMYEAQLNAYAYIGERRGFSPVSTLALVYTEPVTAPDIVEQDSSLTPHGFLLGFSARILPVRTRPALVKALLRRARDILASDSPPSGTAGCEDCAALQELVGLAAP